MRNGRYIFVLSVLLLLSIGIVGNMPEKAFVTYTGANAAKLKPHIVIDCGHGGEDGGAVSDDGVLEKDLNLQIGLYLEKFFVYNGFDVTMTRTDDAAIYDENAKTLREKKKSDLHNRTDIVNSSDNNILISIHQNKFSDSKYFGTQVFYSENNQLSVYIADNIRLAVKGLLQNTNERKCKIATSDIYLLNKATVPAVLVECGFLSNRSETEKLVDKNYQKQLAYSIFSGFLEFYYNNY